MESRRFFGILFAMLIVGCTNGIEDPATVQDDELGMSDRVTYTASGSDLDLWAAPRSNSITAHEQGMLITSAEEAPKSSGATHGVFMQVSEAFEEAASGQQVRIRITARSAPKNGSESFGVAYSTHEVGNSGWHRFQAAPEFQSQSFEYSVPPMQEGRGDFVGIWADTSGSGRALIVESVTLEVLAATGT